jgi:rSAM/selenodomain-associated transferase 1
MERNTPLRVQVSFFSFYNRPVRPLVIVFAKAPVPGAVKTRLGLAPTAAAALHERLTGHLLARLVERFEVELHTDRTAATWAEFRGARRLQVSGDLGARMLHAFEQAARPAAIIGADAPTAPLAALEALLALPADVALAPAEDGGYWAIAARRTAPAMFAGVRWSTPYALLDTLDAARGCGLSVSLGPLWHDIDTPAALRRLPPGLRGEASE